MAQHPANDPSNPLNPLEHDDQILEEKTDISRTAQKVALDLDDAPFLSDIPFDESGPPGPEVAKPREAEVDAQPEGKDEDKSSPKQVLGLLFGLALVLLVVAGGLAFWLTRPPPGEPEPLPPPPPPPPPPLEVKQPPKPHEYFVEMAPFMVAFDQGDEVRFLTLQMTLVTDDPAFSLEIDRKTIILRDAAYYYLNNRPLPTVKRAEAVQMLKDDLISVLNQHLSRPLNDVLLEEYVVH